MRKEISKKQKLSHAIEARAAKGTKLKAASATNQAAEVIARLQRIGNQHDQVENRSAAQLYALVAKAYADARLMKQTPDLWQKVCNSDFWKERNRQQPKPKQTDKIWPTALKIMFGLDERRRVSLYRRALQSSFDADLSPKDVVGLLSQSGGFAKLAAQASHSAHETALRGLAIVFDGPSGFDDRVKQMTIGDKIKLKAVVNKVEGGVVYVKPTALAGRASPPSKSFHG